MKQTRLRRLAWFIASGVALLAASDAWSAEDAPATRVSTTPRHLSVEEQEAMRAAIQTAQADGAARVAEIVAALRAAGYELEAANDKPHVFRVVSPRVSGTAPTVNLSLYPVGTTLEQMRSHGRLIAAGRDYNGPGAFAFGAAYGQPGFTHDLPTIPQQQEVLGAKVLQERVFAALAEFPHIRTTAPRADPRPDARQRELSARISRMDTLRREVALWHAEATIDRETMDEARSRRASALENLESALVDAMGELQKERLGESAAPH